MILDNFFSFWYYNNFKYVELFLVFPTRPSGIQQVAPTPSSPLIQRPPPTRPVQPPQPLPTNAFVPLPSASPSPLEPVPNGVFFRNPAPSNPKPPRLEPTVVIPQPLPTSPSPPERPFNQQQTSANPFNTNSFIQQPLPLPESNQPQGQPVAQLNSQPVNVPDNPTEPTILAELPRSGKSSNELFDKVPGSVGYQRFALGPIDFTSYHLKPSELALPATINVKAASVPSSNSGARAKKAIYVTPSTLPESSSQPDISVYYHGEPNQQQHINFNPTPKPTARAKKAVYHHWSTASPTSQSAQEASQSTLIHQIDFRTFPNDGPTFGPAVRAKKAIYHQPRLEATSPKPQTTQSTLVSHLDFLNYQVNPSENSLRTSINFHPTPEPATRQVT